MLYRLSKLIPVPMRSTYGVEAGSGDVREERARWWQWRGIVWGHWTRTIA